MRNLSKKSKALVAGAAIAGLAGTGVAYAYWTTSGSGTGSAATAAPQDTSALTFSQSTLSAMYPGDTSQVVTTTVANTGDQNAYVTAVKVYLTVTKKQVSGSDVYSGSCSAADFKIGSNSATLAVAPGVAVDAVPLTWTSQDLAKAGGHADATGLVQFNNNTTSNQDGCKDAAVTIHYLAS